MAMGKEYRLLVLHRGGWSAYGHCAPNCTFRASGCVYPTLADLARCVPGSPVVDERDAVGRSPGLVLRSPMVDTRLGLGDVRRFAELRSDPGTRSAMLDSFQAGGGATAAALARLAESDRSFSGMDKVGVGDYVAWWAERGARIGWVDVTSIRWQD
jgi:hypothetical protein